MTKLPVPVVVAKQGLPELENQFHQEMKNSSSNPANNTSLLNWEWNTS